jgi:hypothetical protein
MATPTVSPQPGTSDDPLLPRTRDWHKARVGAAGIGWATAALLPFDGLLDNLVIGVVCLAAVVLARGISRRFWPSLIFGATSVFIVAAVATLFVRFAIPALEGDSLLVRIGSFVLFCAIYTASFALIGRSLNVYDSSPSRPELKYSFSRNVTTSLMVTVQLIAAFYLLARFFSLTLVLLFIAADFIGALTYLLARRALGAELASDRRQAWLGMELVLGHPLFTGAFALLPFVTVFAYPVAVGLVYFTNEVPSDNLTIWVFRLALIQMLSGLPMAMFGLVGTLASANSNERIRIRQLIGASGALFNVGLLLSLFLWSFGFADKENNLRGSRAELSFSPVVVIALLTYFFAVIFVPYAIGTRRARKQELRFLEVHRRALAQLIAALERPHGAGLGSELDQVRSDLQEIEQASMIANPAIAIAEEGTDLSSAIRDKLPAQFANGLTPDAEESYARMRENQSNLLRTDEPRLRFWAQLDAMESCIDEIRFSLEHFSSDGESNLQQRWAEFLRKRREDIDRYIADRPRTKLPAWLTIGGIIAPVISVILDQFGNWVWTQIAESLPS